MCSIEQSKLFGREVSRMKQQILTVTYKYSIDLGFLQYCVVIENIESKLIISDLMKLKSDKEPN
jgi:hypothetical protein